MSDTCRSKLLIFAVMVAVTRQDKKIPTFVAFIAIVVVVAMNASCAPSEDIGIDISYVVINAVINSWCAYTQWLRDSSCACALSSRIVHLHTRASLSTFLAVIAKMKSFSLYGDNCTTIPDIVPEDSSMGSY